MLMSVFRLREKVHGQIEEKNLDLQSHLIPNADLGSPGKHPWLVRTFQSGGLY